MLAAWEMKVSPIHSSKIKAWVSNQLVGSGTVLKKPLEQDMKEEKEDQTSQTQHQPFRSKILDENGYATHKIWRELNSNLGIRKEWKEMDFNNDLEGRSKNEKEVRKK
jgi:hypothetical protein